MTTPTINQVEAKPVTMTTTATADAKAAQPFTITVYSKPSCVQCNATYRALDKIGLCYDVIDITAKENLAHLERAKSEGYLQAPVVFINAVGDDILAAEPLDHWSGFRPDKIRELAERLNGLPA